MSDRWTTSERQVGRETKGAGAEGSGALPPSYREAQEAGAGGGGVAGVVRAAPGADGPM